VSAKSKVGMPKAILVTLIVVAVVMFGVTGYFSYHFYGYERCPACGMLITPEMDEHFEIYDGDGNQVYACCIGCVFRLLDPVRGWDELHIKTFCDWYGPDYPITIDAYDHGQRVEFTPDTVKALIGAKVTGSCASNRIAYNQTAVEALLENGYHPENTMTFQHCALPEQGAFPIASPSKVAPVLAEAPGIAYVPPSPLLPISFAIIGVVVLVAAIVAYRKFMPTADAE